MEDDHNCEALLEIWFVKGQGGELHMFEKYDDAYVYRVQNNIHSAIRILTRA